MLTKLQQFFDRYLATDTAKETPLEHRLQLACSALMMEMVHVDEVVSEQEEKKLKQLLNEQFQLDSEELKALMELAYDKKEQATDYHEFTSLINQHYTQQQKVKLVTDLWQLAYSDSRLDKFEEHLLRRLADLLHVPHHEFIKTKHKVLEQNS